MDALESKGSSGQTRLTFKTDLGAMREKVGSKISVPSLHEIWTWQGDTSILPHKVTEILNQVSKFDLGDPRFQNEDPFDFEKPFKSVQIARQIRELQEGGSFDPSAFFFITYRSQAVGCCMVVRDDPNSLDFKIEYLATVPKSIGSGVEETLVQLALKYILSHEGEVKIAVEMENEFLREHQAEVFAPILKANYGFE
uniref:N-acetyltransferase domain-containing protein n=1 Tax=Strombidium rassoulzadegani TaxID=1082188 RepID=A0A7S3CJJ1_9SPIT